MAVHGKSSMSWFCGSKGHLFIKNYGQLVNFAITLSNMADNNAGLLTKLFAGPKMLCFGGRGYLIELFAECY